MGGNTNAEALVLICFTNEDQPLSTAAHVAGMLYILTDAITCTLRAMLWTLWEVDNAVA